MMTITPITKLPELQSAGLCMFFQHVSVEQAAHDFELKHHRKPERVLTYTDPRFKTLSIYIPLGVVALSASVPLT
jgi:hypothetical protein